MGDTSLKNKSDQAPWPEYVLGIVFLLVFIAVTVGLLSSGSHSDILSLVVIAMAGCLILLVSLPRIQEFSIGKEGVSAKLSELHREVDKQREKVDQQQEVINTLVRYSTSASIFRHLSGIGLLKEYIYHDNPGNRRELYFLRDNGSIQPKPGKGPEFLEFDESLDGQNLGEIAELTPIGWICLRLRQNEVAPEMVNNPANIKMKLSDLPPLQSAGEA